MLSCVQIPALLALAALTTTATAAAQPNVLLIVADDLGYQELTCQGAVDLPTPEICSLADNGIRFTSGYVSAPVCCPSRAGVMTGRYQTRFGHELNAIGVQNADEPIGLPLTESTLADELKKLGYATGLVGKWHLGGHASKHPLSRGFDEFFGFLNEGHYYVPKPYEGVATWLRIAFTPEGLSSPFRRGDYWFSDQMGNRMDEPTYDLENPLLRGREEVSEPAYLTDALGREAASFIDRHRTEPWFLYLAFNAPHSPLQATDEDMLRFLDIPDIQRRIFVGMVASMDRNIGRVLARLRALGIEEDTLIVFLSDNGGPTRELTSSNAPLREGKGRTHEGGIRVPFLAQWKARWPAGKIDRRPVIALDVLPTAVAAAGGEIPADLDGVDLTPFLTGERHDNPHQTLYWRYGSRMALRHGDWKIVGMYEDGRPRDLELYHLAADLGETDDLAARQPERLEELRGLFERYDQEMVDPLWRGDPRSRPTRTNVPLQELTEQ